MNQEDTTFEIVMYVGLLALIGFGCFYFGIDFQLNANDVYQEFNYFFSAVFLILSGLFFSKIIIYFLNEKEQSK